MSCTPRCSVHTVVDKTAQLGLRRRQGPRQNSQDPDDSARNRGRNAEWGIARPSTPDVISLVPALVAGNFSLIAGLFAAQSRCLIRLTVARRHTL